MSRLPLLSLAAGLVLFAGLPAHASDPDDADGLSDPKGLGRFPGFYIASGKIQEFNAHEFETKEEPTPGSDFDQPKVTKEGRFYELYFVRKEGTPEISAVQLIRNFENAVKKAGGRALVKQIGNKWYREMAVFTMPVGKSERWVQIQYVGEDSYQLYAVDVEAMEQKVELSAAEMADAIGRIGFVAVRGILFDTNKADVKPESESTLTEIVALLKANPKLRVSVEGHTDNVGDRKANEALSKRRAEAVLKVLVSKGIDAKRLKAEGRGDSIPVADNRIEDGRALNRRVELVKF